MLAGQGAAGASSVLPPESKVTLEEGGSLPSSSSSRGGIYKEMLLLPKISAPTGCEERGRLAGLETINLKGSFMSLCGENFVHFASREQEVFSEAPSVRWKHNSCCLHNTIGSGLASHLELRHRQQQQERHI